VRERGNYQARAILGVALDLAEQNFERQYASGGAGLVMPGAFAVSSDGRELSRIAVLPDSESVVPSDRAYGEMIKQAFALNPEVASVAVAYAAVRIDVGWPRILAWYASRITCQAKPRFAGERLTGWDEDWAEEFSANIPQGARGGLVELEMSGVGGAGLALMVRERLRLEGRA
jgi:hypothetical protein